MFFKPDPQLFLSVSRVEAHALVYPSLCFSSLKPFVMLICLEGMSLHWVPLIHTAWPQSKKSFWVCMWLPVCLLHWRLQEPKGKRPASWVMVSSGFWITLYLERKHQRMQWLSIAPGPILLCILVFSLICSDTTVFIPASLRPTPNYWQVMAPFNF